MELEVIFQGAIGLGLLVFGLWNGWHAARVRREARGVRSEASAAAYEAKAAREQTKEIGNGFAKDVLTRLERIEKNGQATHDLADTTHRLMVGHLEAHTKSDLHKEHP